MNLHKDKDVIIFVSDLTPTRGTEFFNQNIFDIPPCNINSDCNMSPVIPDFFIAFKSMKNAQTLDHTNGLAKYV